jgi:hypothetical protein
MGLVLSQAQTQTIGVAGSSHPPLLLLDMDGVLCPVGPGPGEPMSRLELPGGVVMVSLRRAVAER